MAIQLTQKNIDQIIELTKQTAEALVFDPLSKFSIEDYRLLKRYFLNREDGEQIETLRKELSDTSDTEDKTSIRMKIQFLNTRQKRFEKECDENKARELNKELIQFRRDHAQKTLKPLQKKLGNYLKLLSGKLLEHTTEGYPLREEIKKNFIKGGLDSVSRDNINSKAKKVTGELELIKAKLELEEQQQQPAVGKQAETGRNNSPSKESRIGAWLWKLYEKTLKVVIDAFLERVWPK
ncbi:MAG: hypothetical protein ACYSR9_06290 [Planctomycetota bacterium]